MHTTYRTLFFNDTVQTQPMASAYIEAATHPDNCNFADARYALHALATDTDATRGLKRPAHALAYNPLICIRESGVEQQRRLGSTFLGEVMVLVQQAGVEAPFELVSAVLELVATLRENGIDDDSWSTLAARRDLAAFAGATAAKFGVDVVIVDGA